MGFGNSATYCKFKNWCGSVRDEREVLSNPHDIIAKPLGASGRPNRCNFQNLWFKNEKKQQKNKNKTL